jgi:hypothetical protein
MSLADLGAIGEFISSIAVVITLIYLAIQIRENTESVKETNSIIHTDRMIGHSRAIASDPQLADIFRRGSADRSSLKDAERWQFGTYMWSLFVDFQSEYFAKKQDRLDAYHWQFQERNMVLYLMRPGIEEWWNDLYLELDEEFVAYVTQLVHDAKSETETGE